LRIFQIKIKIEVILEFQGEKELRMNFGKPNNSQNSFVNNLYLVNQNKKNFYRPLKGKDLTILGKIKIQITI